MQLGIWWRKVFKSCKYTTLSLVVKACSSILTRPHVEASFSCMNDIIDKKSNHTGIETYSGIINVKYSLLTKTSSELYKRSDPLHNPVEKNMWYFIRTSHPRFKKREEKKRRKRRNTFVKKKIFKKELRYTAKSNAWT